MCVTHGLVWGARDGFLYKEACELRPAHADELGKEKKGWREDMKKGKTTGKEHRTKQKLRSTQDAGPNTAAAQN